MARLARHRQHLELARLVVLKNREGAGEPGLDLAAQHVGHDLRTTLVGDVLEVDAGQLLELLPGQARRRLRTAEAELAGVGLGIRDELAQGLRGQRRDGDDHPRRASDQRDRRDIGHRVVGHLGLQARIDDVRRDHHHEAVPVGRGLEHEVRSGDAVGARAVLHKNVLPPGFAELLRDLAADDVRAAARRIRHHDAHRLGRKHSLRVGCYGNQRGDYRSENSHAVSSNYF